MRYLRALQSILESMGYVLAAVIAIWPIFA